MMPSADVTSNQGLRLDDHQGHIVSHDVVQLLGDANALLGDRPVGQ